MATVDTSPAWRMVGMRPRAILDPLIGHGAAAYQASSFEVNEQTPNDRAERINETFRAATADGGTAADIERRLIERLPEVSDASMEDVNSMIVATRFMHDDPEMESPWLDTMREQMLTEYGGPRWEIVLDDMNGETIGRIATLSNIPDGQLDLATERVLDAFGYRIADAETGTLERIDPWDPNTIDTTLEGMAVAVGDATIQRDRDWRMDRMLADAIDSPKVVAVMTDRGRFDAYAGSAVHGSDAILSWRYEANIPREFNDGMVIGFAEPRMNLRTVDGKPVDLAGPEHEEEIKNRLIEQGAHGRLVDTGMNVAGMPGMEGVGEDPWAGEDICEEEPPAVIDPWAVAQPARQPTSYGPSLN